MEFDLNELKILAGISNNTPKWSTYTGSNISLTGTEKAQLQRAHKIEPGTEAWFRLWFTKPYLTNTTPI